MSEVKHTPGPWRESNKVENHGTHWEARTIAQGGGTVARVTSTGVHGPDRKGEMYANARLIAAAPELLAAARDAQDFIERNLNHGSMDVECRTDLTEALKRIEAAIAKARADA